MLLSGEKQDVKRCFQCANICVKKRGERIHLHVCAVIPVKGSHPLMELTVSKGSRETQWKEALSLYTFWKLLGLEPCKFIT